jgi:hypothetical protein
MSSVKATWLNGQIVLEGQADWPEGSRLVISEEALSPFIFMTEDEQSDAPESIQAWIDDLLTIPPVPQDLAVEAEQIAWDKKMSDFNRDAVRQQFEKGKV